MSRDSAFPAAYAVCTCGYWLHMDNDVQVSMLPTENRASIGKMCDMCHTQSIVTMAIDRYRQLLMEFHNETGHVLELALDAEDYENLIDFFEALEPIENVNDFEEACNGSR